MKKIIVLLMLIMSINVYAECDKKELARLKKLAENVEVNYTSEVKEKKKNDKVLYKYGEYTLHATNINDEIKVRVYQDYYANLYKEFKGNKGIGEVGPFYDGEKVAVTIEAHTKNGCSGEKLRTVTVKLPYYNIYSENDLCNPEDIFSETNCCQKFMENNFPTKDKFDTCLNDYYMNEYITESPYSDEEDGEQNVNYWLYIIIAIVVILIIISITIIIKRKSKKSDI